MLNNNELKEKALRIKLLVLDVDGVLTDGRLYYTPEEMEIKCFNTLDGHGIKMLQKGGVEVAIITGRTSQQVIKRAGDLGIVRVITGREDKFTALQQLVAGRDLQLDEIAFMGDDWPDLSAMTQVGLALGVPNAHQEVLSRAHWISDKEGGKGAVREACDMLLKIQGNYHQCLQSYISAGEQ